MMAVELETCRVPMDLASLVPLEGYIMACAAFYERGFGVPSHRFLHSLLQFYGLELHHLTHSGIMHMAAFVTLCEAYMGIERLFNLWNLFCARIWQGPSVEAAVLGSVDIFVRSGHIVDPYFNLQMFCLLDGCQKVWFFLKNDTDAPFTVLMCSCPIRQPNWGTV
jgi:hypothetical protein